LAACETAPDFHTSFFTPFIRRVPLLGQQIVVFSFNRRTTKPKNRTDMKEPHTNLASVSST
jgi:hypothetical protein